MDGFYRWPLWMAIMDGSYRWPLWMAFIAGPYGWLLWMARMDSKYAWSLWMARMDDFCGWPLWIWQLLFCSIAGENLILKNAFPFFLMAMHATTEDRCRKRMKRQKGWYERLTAYIPVPRARCAGVLVLSLLRGLLEAGPSASSFYILRLTRLLGSQKVFS